MSIITNVINYVKNLYKTEPVVVLSAVAAAVVFVAANFGIVVDETSVLSALEYVVPILLGGAVARSLVSPVKK
jgi:ABC-type Co2+ transport system permease subunit